MLVVLLMVGMTDLHVATVTREKRELQDQLDIYKPVLLALVVVLACTGAWLLALALTGTTSSHLPSHLIG